MIKFYIIVFIMSLFYFASCLAHALCMEITYSSMVPVSFISVYPFWHML